MRMVQVKLLHQTSTIYIGSGLLHELPTLLLKHGLTGELIVISDTRVAELYGTELVALLAAAGLTAALLQVPEGEGAKSIAQCEWLYGKLILGHYNRDAIIIALGGGVPGDLAGFVAATYLRGIRLVQAPTTLLAQVDSSVGGKTGVNHVLGKNLIGAFYQPELVCIDPSVLATLDLRERLAGMGEVVKYALIQDRALMETLSRQLDALLELRDDGPCEEVIETCCSIKAAIASEDEREKGCRALLNFGHTIGHALEAAGDFRHFRHGEAVTRGMAGAIYLSHRLGYLSGNETEKGLFLLERLKPPLPPADLTADSVLPFMAHDKKRHAGAQSWILLNSLGKAFISSDVPGDLIPDAIRFACRETWSGYK